MTIQATNNNDYYINKLVNNNFNDYKYFYLYKLAGIINVVDAKWYFNISLICTGDFYLPPNSLYANFSFPSQEISNVNFNVSSNQSLINQTIPNSNYSKVYDGNFSMSVIEDNFFTQPLINAKIPMETKLLIDTNTLNDLQTNIIQTDLDNFTNEVYSQINKTSFYYSNTFINELRTGYFKNVYDYYIENDSVNESYNIIQYSSNSYVAIKTPITNLLTLSSNIEFNILQINVEFIYSTYRSNEIKKLEYQDNHFKNVVNSINIDFETNTLYDFENDSINKSLLGIKGFYCPDICAGEYKLEVMINQLGSTKKIIYTNKFSFIKSNNYFELSAKTIVINDLTNFKRKVF